MLHVLHIFDKQLQNSHFGIIRCGGGRRIKMKMKKLLSVFLTVAMLLSTVTVMSVAATDTCIKFTDTTGDRGYSAGSGAVNDWVVANDGGTVIFDVYVESLATPASGMASRIVAFSGDSPLNFTMFDLTNSRITAGTSTANWPTSLTSSNYTEYSGRNFSWQTGRWYELAFQFDGGVATVYVDGIAMISAEFDDTFESDYLLLYPQFCTIYIDNLRICDKEYNVRDRAGTVYGATDFKDITSVSGVSCWDFSGPGYSVSTNGRPMPELGDMVPARTVAPVISGAYAKYAEGGKTGTVPINVNFTPYNGFTIVQDLRFNTKTVLGNFAIRFGKNYIAGYDWDTQSFRISQRSGYGFNTSDAFTYAQKSYALTLRQNYEIAVRQYGETVSVYLNGVMMCQATNESFATGYDKIELNCYRSGAAIDNMIIAYPDYDVKEAKGSYAAKLTFDESVEYINSKCGFGFDGSTDYTLSAEKDAAKLTVNNALAVDYLANVTVSLANFPEATAFKLSVSYPNGFSVAKSTIASGLSGTGANSDTNANPYVVMFAAKGDSTVSSGDLANIIFNTPTTAGKYTVNATLTPYIGDVPCASITGSGTISVPEPPLSVGLPEGVAYDGEVLTWEPVEDIGDYEILLSNYGVDNELSLDYVEETEYYLSADMFMGDPGVYVVRIVVSDVDYNPISVSKDLIVIREENGELYCGLDAYVAKLCLDLAALAEGPYTKDNQAMIDSILAEAEATMVSITNYDLLMVTYADYAAQIAEIPIGGEEEDDNKVGDVDGNGIVNADDYVLLSKLANGANVECLGNPDVDRNGIVDANDVVFMSKLANGATIA